MYDLVYETTTCTLSGRVYACADAKNDDLIKLAAEAWGIEEYDMCDWTITKIESF